MSRTCTPGREGHADFVAQSHALPKSAQHIRNGREVFEQNKYSHGGVDSNNFARLSRIRLRYQTQP
jgi:hypothetical protein